MAEARWEESGGEPGGTLRVCFTGRLDAADRQLLHIAFRRLKTREPGAPPRSIVVDLTGVQAMSELGRLAVVEQLNEVRATGWRVVFHPKESPWRRSLVALWAELRRIPGSEELASGTRPARTPPATKPGAGLVGAIGTATLERWRGVTRAAGFVAAALAWTIRALVGGKARLTQFWEVTFRVGVDAIPILTILAFLIGIVLADQGAQQGKEFGVTHLVPGFVAIAFVREMGPLLTAILFAGRTGSAYTAVLASMQDSEEMQALQLMGHHPIGFLVVPRLLAALVSMPILVLWAMVAGVGGSFLYCTTQLSVDTYQYLTLTRDALKPSSFLLAGVKALTFGFIIAMVGCYRGMQEVRGADEVGRQTTSSVVWSIFLVIVASSFWTVTFSKLEL